MKKSSSQKNNQCPYINNKDCARPNKDPNGYCAGWLTCVSYKLLEACKDIKEEKKDGKEHSC